ncbi:Flp family type IVb pilin [Thalassotalea aquiviva]|uniref:Flp family type IVb pilin n=1 Tax=Thalassotalea aquiviva TaxID=3242415 RepID=UPI00352A14F6
MQNLKKLFSEFIEDESGLTAVEYAIAGALVSVAVVTAFTQLGTAVEGTVNKLCTAASGSSAATPTTGCTSST